MASSRCVAQHLFRPRGDPGAFPAARRNVRGLENDFSIFPKRKVTQHLTTRAAGGGSGERHGSFRTPPSQGVSFEDGGEGDVELVRVSKLLAERGLCSRREADRFIERGLVLVDGVRVSELGTRARRSQNVSLAAAASRQQAQLVTVVLHKPVGYVSHADDEDLYPTAACLLTPERHWLEPPPPRNSKNKKASASRYPTSRDSRDARDIEDLRGLAPAGRLDIESTGMLVMTQDGRVARTLVGEDSTIEKEYLVRVQGELSDEGLRLLNHGLKLDGRPLKPAVVEWVNEDQLRFVLREGKKRQIRRMCDQVGLEVVGLKRIRIGRIPLGDLPNGQWRFLRPSEQF